MTSIVFDPDARSEFLYAVKYYEDCQKDLGLIQKFPYAIYYSIEPDHIRIIAVAHTRRKPGFWQSLT